MLHRSTTAALTAALLALAPFGAAAHEASSKGVTIAHPWARATPPGAKVGVAFLEIKADPGKADRLVAASTPVAGRAELHEHIHEGDVMKMRRVDAIPVKGGGSVVLEPSGLHLMLMDLKAPLKEGDLVPLKLRFEKAGEIEIEATVEPVGAMGPHGMNHQPGHEKHQPAGQGHKHH